MRHTQPREVDRSRRQVGARRTAQYSGPGAGIARQLGLTSLYGLRHTAPAARFLGNLRQVSRLSRTALVGIEKPFDDTILKGVKADHGKRAAFTEQALSGKEALNQLIEFAI